MSSTKDVPEETMEVDFQDPLEGIDVAVNNSPSDLETEAKELLNYIDTDEPFGNTEANDSLNELKPEELILDFEKGDQIANKLKLEELLNEHVQEPDVDLEWREPIVDSDREPIIDLKEEASISNIRAPIIILEPEDLDEFNHPPPSPKGDNNQDGKDLHEKHKISREENLNIQLYYKAKSEQFSRKADIIKENIATVKNVLNVCQNMHIYGKSPSTHDPQSHRIDYLQKLTQDDANYLQNTVNKKSNFVNKSITHLINTMKPIQCEIKSFIYNDIRKVFVEFYVKKKQIPTKNDFMKALLKLSPPELSSVVSVLLIETLVENNLIKYHHLSKFRRYIITEHPELVYKRHKFLQQISECRSREAGIIYVSICNISKKNPAGKYLAIAASAAGLIDKCETIDYRFKVDENVENPEIRSWIQYDLISKIAPGWIIHLTTIKKNDTTPTAFSSKLEMLEWLSSREVPCDSSFHAAQLYSLIKLHKEKPKYFYEDLFTSAGFRVINCPIEYESLDFFRNITTTDDLEDPMQIEQRLISEEQQMMKEDEEMDRIVNNLFLMVKNNDVNANDFPEDCHGTKGDNVYAHIGNIIID